MHPEEIPVTDGLVRRLLHEQLPELAGLPLHRVRSTGTVNAIYRLGDDLCARLPLARSWAEDIDKEWRWLPTLAPHLSLQVPEPVARGEPNEAYPCSWAVYRWIAGEPYADGLVADEQQAATDLAGFVSQLRRIEPYAGAPPAGRKPLTELDALTRDAIAEAGSGIDGGAVTAAWERAREAPVWEGSPVWIHADLLRPNVLVRGGRVRAVLDFGSAGVGDPAADVIAAWSVFGATGRAAFREGLAVDEDTWNRARGFALHQALLIIPYYRVTNPGFVTLAQRTVAEVLADVGR